MPRIPDARETPPWERLRMASDEQREAIWPKMSPEERKAIWEGVQTRERWDLLPPSERRVRSHCHAALLYRQEIYLVEGNRHIPWGKAPFCSGCGCAAGSLSAYRGKVPKGFTQATWDAMKGMQTEFGRTRVEYRDGVLVPFGAKPQDLDRLRGSRFEGFKEEQSELEGVG